MHLQPSTDMLACHLRAVCSVNSNIAAMVANPEDLLHGRENGGLADTWTAARAIEMYRTTPPTGSRGLQAIDTKGAK